MITLSVQNLGKHFGYRWIFRDVNLSVTGGVLGIAGLNGSGKSTLIRCLAGLYAPDSGSVTWQEGQATLNREAFRRQSGFAAPYIHHYAELTCLENLQFLMDSRGKPAEEGVLLGALDQLGIGAKAHAAYKSLSSGQQQRIKLTAATLHNPDILMLDEPGTNLDQNGMAYVSGLVSARRHQALTIIASNDTRELDLCDTIFTIA
ncbi:MAG: ABC-type heme export system ATPase component CcmA [Bacteroidetes bacterium HLUCCA01]|nr:MAG: ABC-type heme export system ATPase component CcmA [Bacteroidetes bacterium HLUCCA01]